MPRHKRHKNGSRNQQYIALQMAEEFGEQAVLSSLDNNLSQQHKHKSTVHKKRSITRRKNTAKKKK